MWHSHAAALAAMMLLASSPCGAAELKVGAPDPATPLAPGKLIQPAQSNEITCETKAGWGDPYPSVIILRRLIPACGAADVQVIRTNGDRYPRQCVPLHDGKLVIATATGDYYLTIGEQSVSGDFMSKLSADYSRVGLTWECTGALSQVTERAWPIPVKTSASRRRGATRP